MVDLSDDVLDGVLAELNDARVLEPWGPSGWRFRHELLREVATELAPPSVRRSLHRKVADALVNYAGGDPDWQLVATHYEQAQNSGEAVVAYQRASTDARRRGALAEARGYLTHALVQVDEQPPGRARDLREMAVRMERGFLASAAEGPMNRGTAVDFEECLRLGGTDVRDDEVVATLLALTGYYFAIGDLPRSARVLTSLRAGINAEREFFRPVIEASIGIAAWLNGGFTTAREQMEAATAEFDAAGQHTLEALWFAPTDPMTMAHGILSLDRLARGDFRGAEAQVLQAARRADELQFSARPVQPGLRALLRDLDTHRGAPARSRRHPRRRARRPRRKAQLRSVGAVGRCSASHHRCNEFDFRRRGRCRPAVGSGHTRD